LLGYLSTHVQGGVKVHGIQLTEEQTRWLLRIFFLLSLFFAFVIVPLLFVFLFGNQRIALTRESILLPKPTRLGLSSEESEICFADIQSIDVRAFASTKLLRIEYIGGVVSIMSNMLRDKRMFNDLVDSLQRLRLDASSVPDP
jgi:hypothetical protein